ncbi:glycosyltransferase [Pedobacter helvus]|uniref:Glycosyltransferase n=1 Tax=Pedobacter helvus TaxID=2563444 RepID=A0ABW9JLP2_9SPHI|nr:glycosyltransferase [Pedobacter ureilyticus]
MTKKIILACSNYYPHSFGGTEVYVESHAKHLQDNGNLVYIITSAPFEQFNEENTVYEDDNLKVCRYEHNATIIFGLHYQKEIRSELIYSKYELNYDISFKNFIKGQPELLNLDVMHIHSFTPTIGVNLFKCILEVNQVMKVITNYHVPLSCPTGTLMRNGKLTECDIKPNLSKCLKCSLKTQKKSPYILARTINLLKLKTNIVPAVFRAKYLINLELEAFKYLKQITSEWWCYSEGIKKVLQLNEISEKNIKMARHGVNDIFLSKNKIEKDKNITIYLFSGRLVKIKGITTLLKAWLKLPIAENKQLWLTANTESDSEEIRALIKVALQRNDIFFIGTKTQKELVDIYAKAHFVVIPSEWYEIGPLVFHEAISQQANIICSNLGGCKELADYYKATSLDFDAGSAHSLAEAIIKSRYSNPTSVKIKTLEEHFQLINE